MPHVSPSAAAIAFLIAPIVFAATYCRPTAHLGALDPPTTDCLAIVAHIPSVPLPIVANPWAALYPPNSPFIPRAVFRYGECLIRISYHSTPHPSAEDGPGGFETGDLVEEARRFTPDQPLTGASLFQIRTASKLAIENIIAQCTTCAFWGLNWEFVNVPEVPGAWYAVELSRNTRSKGKRVASDVKQAVADGKWALRGNSRSNRGQGYGKLNKYRIATFDLS